MAPWLVTGGSGFLGSHVLNGLAATGRNVIAMGRRPPASGSRVDFCRADLDDPDAVRRALAEIRPAVVLHAAGRTPPSDPAELYRSNTLATVHLLDSLRALGEPVRVVLAGSAAELGPVPGEALPVGESYPSHPVDAYGLSKLLATSAGLAAGPPLEVMIARVFNPIGPGLPASQAFGRFAHQLRAGTAAPTVRRQPSDAASVTLTVGDLDARRDFVDVRDVARAFLALAERGRAGSVYHVGTGRSWRVGDGLDELIRLSGRRVRVDVDRSLIRGGPTDSRADVCRVVSHTGWQPEIAFEQSLADQWHALIRS